MILKIICSKSNSIPFNRSLEMRNEVETQDQLSQGTSIQQNIMHYLAIAWGLISMILKIICSKSNSIPFNRSLEMRNEVETQDQLSQETSTQQNIMRYLAIAWGLISMILKIICSKSNSIPFNRSLEMRNEVETQDQRSQETSTQQNIMRYLPIAGGLISMILKISCSKSNSTPFNRSLEMRNEVETQEQLSQGTFYALFADCRGSDINDF